MTAAPTSQNASQIEVRRGGIEPPTVGFSVRLESANLPDESENFPGKSHRRASAAGKAS